MKHTAILALALTLLVCACNTIQGAGEDLQAGGKAIANTADKTKDAITGNSSSSSSSQQQ